MSKDLDTYMKRFEVESEQDWRGEMKDIPFIEFPANWKVKVIPPFANACVRFLVILPSGTQKSIYLDTRNALGFMNYSYWEVYPHTDSEPGRVEMQDVAGLLEMIAYEDKP